MFRILLTTSNFRHFTASFGWEAKYNKRKSPQEGMGFGWSFWGYFNITLGPFQWRTNHQWITGWIFKNWLKRLTAKVNEAWRTYIDVFQFPLPKFFFLSILYSQITLLPFLYIPWKGVSTAVVAVNRRKLKPSSLPLNPKVINESDASAQTGTILLLLCCQILKSEKKVIRKSCKMANLFLEFLLLIDEACLLRHFVNCLK